MFELLIDGAEKRRTGSILSVIRCRKSLIRAYKTVMEEFGEEVVAFTANARPVHDTRHKSKTLQSSYLVNIVDLTRLPSLIVVSKA